MKWTTENIEYSQNSIDLVNSAKALGHSTRLEILNHLDAQSYCFTGDLVDIFPIAQYLKELKKADLIQGKFESPKIRYCINENSWEKAKLLFNEFLK